jgi:fermentation-respiration switch protein FrsA (DUF1100 family)
MSPTDSSSPKFILFRIPRTVQAAISLLFILSIFFFGLRRLEYAMTYHPLPYIPGPAWTPLANGENVWFRVTDGERVQRVHGWFVRSQSQPTIATVLFCHGNGGNLTHVAWVAKELSKYNLDVLIFDYRGYGRSEGKITDEWGLYADADAAYYYLMRERNVKPEKLVLYGESLGTTAAIDLASRRACGALIVESGLSSASDMGAKAVPFLPRWLYWLGKNRFESERKIANVNCPVLVTHGTSDKVIPVEQGRKLFEAAREPKKLKIVEGGDHNLFGNSGREYIEQIIEFIRAATAK